MNFILWPIRLLPIAGPSVQSDSLPSVMNFRKLGMASNKQLAPDPIASLILHRIDIYLFTAKFDALMLAKNESSADANTLSGRADKISNFPSMKHPFFSTKGFLIWLTRVDFLRQNNQSITTEVRGVSANSYGGANTRFMDK